MRRDDAANGGKVNRFPGGSLPRAEGMSVAEARAYINGGGAPRDIYADVETFEPEPSAKT